MCNIFNQYTQWTCDNAHKLNAPPRPPNTHTHTHHSLLFSIIVQSVVCLPARSRREEAVPSVEMLLHFRLKAVSLHRRRSWSQSSSVGHCLRCGRRVGWCGGMSSTTSS